MKQNTQRMLKTPLAIAILAATLSTNSWAISTQQLLQNIISHLPEQQLSQGFTQTQQALQQNQNALFPESPALIVTHENDALTGSEEIQNWEVGVEATLWRSEQKQGLKALSEANQQQQQALQAVLALKGSGTLRQILAAVQQAQVELLTAQQQLVQTQQLTQMIDTRVQIGASPKLDRLLAQKSVIEAKQALIQAESNLNTAISTYQQWTGTTELPEQYQETLAKVETPNWWLQHPKVQQLQAEIAALQAQKQQIKGERKNPIQLYAGLNRETSKNSSANTKLVVQVTLPLGENALNQMSLAEQSQALLTQQSALHNLERQLKIQKIQAEEQVKQAQQQAQLAKAQLSLAKQTLQMAKQSYQAGETGIQNLLVSQQQLLNAQKKYQMSQIKTQQAIAQFNQVLGVTFQ